MTVAMSERYVQPERPMASPDTLTGGQVFYAPASGWLTPHHESWAAYRTVPVYRNGHVEDRIEQLAGLRDNWDSYGARQLDRELLERVRSFVSNLCRQGVPLPSLVPSSSGSVVAEWRDDELTVEIEIDPEGGDWVHVRRGADVHEYEGNLGAIAGTARRLLEDALTRLARTDPGPQG